MDSKRDEASRGDVVGASTGSAHTTTASTLLQTRARWLKRPRRESTPLTFAAARQTSRTAVIVEIAGVSWQHCCASRRLFERVSPAQLRGCRSP